MEESNLTVGTLKPFWGGVFRTFLVYFKGYFQTSASLCDADYLDGLKTKEEIYNQVYEDIQSNFLNRL